MDKTTTKKYSHKAEIIRFLVIGIVATIFDFLTKLLVSGLMKNANERANLGVSTLAGFIIGVAVNYIFSVLWVFQNVADKNAAKKQSKLWLFVFLGFIGLLISLVIFYGSHYFFVAVTAGAINLVSGSKAPMNIFHGDWSFFSNGSFWVYFAVFCVSTLIVLVWNYKSRKKWIFIEPKEETPAEVKAEESSEVKETTSTETKSETPAEPKDGTNQTK
jgi:putative flippase GtrA